MSLLYTILYTMANMGGLATILLLLCGLFIRFIVNKIFQVEIMNELMTKHNQYEGEDIYCALFI